MGTAPPIPSEQPAGATRTDPPVGADSAALADSDVSTTKDTVDVSGIDEVALEDVKAYTAKRSKYKQATSLAVNCPVFQLDENRRQ